MKTLLQKLSKRPDLPLQLLDILQEMDVDNLPFGVDNLDDFHRQWVTFARNTRAKYPFLEVEDDGETIRLGELSPGCRLCKKGRWDCIFLTGRCNMSCTFCCSPHLEKADAIYSAFGVSRNEIAENYQKAGIEGIAFTGGEVFLVFPTLIAWAGYFRKRFPKAYIWLYTNGRLASAERLKKLADCGIDEIRFNTAATGYIDSQVLKAMELSAKIGLRVVVEIPCIASEIQLVTAALNQWSNNGVSHLHLHELIKEPGSPSEKLSGDFCELIMDDGHRTKIELNSRIAIATVIAKVHQLRIALSVNDCSMQNKVRQVKGRRMAMARLAGIRTEKLDQNGNLRCWFAWRDGSSLDGVIYHPGAFAQADDLQWNYIECRQRMPLVAGGRLTWTSFFRGRIDGRNFDMHAAE